MNNALLKIGKHHELITRKMIKTQMMILQWQDLWYCDYFGVGDEELSWDKDCFTIIILQKL